MSASMAAAGDTRVMISTRRVRQRETIGSQVAPQAERSEPIYRFAGCSWALKEWPRRLCDRSSSSLNHGRRRHGRIRAQIPDIGSERESEVGSTAGGGVEAGIVDGLSAKLEYLYVDFGTLIAALLAPILWSTKLNSTRICFVSDGSYRF